jgi:hypothetical protein
MSKWDSHRGKGNTAFNMLAQAGDVAKMTREHNTWMHERGQLCWVCQKESRPQQGCVLNLKPGFKKYVCKECVDARKAKEIA